MWTIRQEQVDAFRQAALQQFEDRMVEHLKVFAPKQWEVMGELDGRKLIRMGIEHASGYRFTNQGPVRFYIELMFMFGSYFDTDPQLPWVRPILSSSDLKDQMTRADQLYDAMNEYLIQVSGPDHKYLTAALQRLSHTRIEDLVKVTSGEDLNLEEQCLRQLDRIYPQKYAYLGERVLRALIQHAFDLALRYGMANQKGMILMAVLTFAVGYDFPFDPLCGWITRRLNSERWSEPNERTEELLSKAMIYLKYVVFGERK